jgi:hypothetical protein
VFILEYFASAAPDRMSSRGKEFCHPLWVRTQYPDSSRLCRKGRQSGRQHHMRICVEVTPFVVSTTGGIEPASLASMTLVMGSVSS